jgi:DNA-binding helix-hairpin-helix protein with protein kinase domain
LGYLDMVTKFTRPLVSQNNYAQQALMPQQANGNTLSFTDYYKQGHTAYQERDYKQAVDNFTQAIQQEPTNPKPLINRGNARLQPQRLRGRNSRLYSSFAG